MPENDLVVRKCLLCPDHIPFVERITRLAVIQENNVAAVTALVSEQKRMFEKLDEIHVAMEAFKGTATLNQAAVTAQIDQERLKVKPIYWIFAVAGTAIVSALTNLLVKLVIK